MTSDPGRWRRVRELFEVAADMEGPDRDQFLSRECGDDEALLAEVHELLRAEGNASASFIEPPDLQIGLSEQNAAGRRLGEFELLEVIGRGGMGTVYRARQIGLDREVAVKVVGRHTFGNEAESERFDREARAAARLDHPKIAKVLVAGSDADFAWFAMELVPGHSLATEIAGHRAAKDGKPGRSEGLLIPALSTAGRPRAAAEVVAGLCEALAHAHSQGVVHRDVKPSNLIVTPAGDIRLVDFGVARDEKLGTITRSDQLIGSVLYMSPEQARVVSAPVDERTDVYSAGVVLYELLTQNRPYDGDTTHEVLTKIRLAAPRPVRSMNKLVSRDLDLICQKAMARDVRDRYVSAEAMHADLERFLDGNPVEATRIHWARRAVRWGQRRSRVLMVGALAAMFGLTAWALSRDAAATPKATLVIEGQGDSRVGLRWLDEKTQQPGPEVGLGGEAGEGEKVAAGFVRVVIRSRASLIPREFSRWLAPGETTRVAVPNGLIGHAEDPLEGMVLIDGGLFQPVQRRGDTPHTGETYVVEPFYLDLTEVSVGDYRRYIAERPGKAEPFLWQKFDASQLADELPMTMVSWEDARSYAEWQGKRLPTLAEWMWAARGKELRRRPWDPAPGWRGVNSGPLYQNSETISGSVSQYLANAHPVQSFPGAATPEGVLNMLGNVSEWTESPYFAAKAPRPSLFEFVRVVCGGHWENELTGRDLASFDLRDIGPKAAHFTIGFRCALSAR